MLRMSSLCSLGVDGICGRSLCAAESLMMHKIKLKRSAVVLFSLTHTHTHLLVLLFFLRSPWQQHHASKQSNKGLNVQEVNLFPEHRMHLWPPHDGCHHAFCSLAAWRPSQPNPHAGLLCSQHSPPYSQRTDPRQKTNSAFNNVSGESG